MSNSSVYNASQVKKARKIIRDASKLLVSKGHCKKRYCTSGGKFCIVGAINYCHHGSAYWNSFDINLLNIIYDELNDQVFKEHGISLVTWNDKPSTNLSDIIKLLSKVDKKLYSLSKN